MGMFSRIGSFFSLQEEDDGDELYEDAPSGSPSRVVPFSQNSSKRSGTEVSVYSPRGFQDVVEIADALRRRQVVIVNLQTADRATLQRVVDFTSGVAYTLDGKIQKLADAIYLVVPAGIVVNAAGLRDSMTADGSLDFMTNRG
ncbi:MAG: cell division protein SepF [Vulcanimicrobiaceae bacterium]